MELPLTAIIDATGLSRPPTDSSSSGSGQQSRSHIAELPSAPLSTMAQSSIQTLPQANTRQEAHTAIDGPRGATEPTETSLNINLIISQHDPIIPRYRATQDCDGGDELALISLKKGESICVTMREEGYWWLAKTEEGRLGYVPACFLEEVVAIERRT